MEKREFLVVGIKWIKSVKSAKLPTEMRVTVTSDDVKKIKDGEQVMKFIADTITKETGYAHDGWCQTIEYEDKCFLPYMAFKADNVLHGERYVTATNDTLSGWGQAVDKTAKVIIPVPDEETAEKVKNHLKAMGGFSRIRVSRNVPPFRNDMCVHTVYDYRPFAN